MKKICGIIIFLVIAAGCKEKYLTLIQSPPTGYLIVEGFISSSQSPSTIKLSRSTKLYDTVNIIYEQNAVVNIVGENNEVFPLTESGNGVYTSASLHLNTNERYRLQIKTQGNKEYQSDFVKVRHTPDIDSITWQREGDGLKIFINTHDPLDSTRYYKWDYEETWEIHSPYLSTLKYVYDPSNPTYITGLDYRDPVAHAPDTTMYKCWNSSTSASINIGSSEKLSKDVIYLPLFTIEPGSERLSVLYSVLVKQYALSKEAYSFFQKMKKNTEQLGSIFDPQPSELQGNIHCVSDPKEPVVGYVEISEEKEQRHFIANAEVPLWNFKTDCMLKKFVNNPDSINVFASNLTPVMPEKIFIMSILTFSAAAPTCVDCRLRGTNVRPPFWP
ncbi:MAG: DUF4249 domain-containing protein [Ginsengibacter sp.]